MRQFALRTGLATLGLLSFMGLGGSAQTTGACDKTCGCGDVATSHKGTRTAFECEKDTCYWIECPRAEKSCSEGTFPTYEDNCIDYDDCKDDSGTCPPIIDK